MKVKKFASMMTVLGHEVILYDSESNEAECSESVACITKEEQASFGYNGPEDYLKIDFNNDPIWDKFVPEVIEQIKERIRPKDFICLITSTPFQPIMDAFPDNISVEFGIGYPHTMAKFRVFESYAWMHYVYGREQSDGFDFDAVIPNYFEVDDFPLVEDKGDYFLYIGRLTEKKGYAVAQEVCTKLGKRLVIAGPGTPPEGVEYAGVVGPKKRAELMGNAQAVFVPTRYVGPFEGVAVEALLCGTPVITTDFGAFTEYVVNGENGFRCRSFQDYLEAVACVESGSLAKPSTIQSSAQHRFGTEVVAKEYERYFQKLSTLWGQGWYS